MSDSVNRGRAFEVLTATPVRSRRAPRDWSDDDKARLVAETLVSGANTSAIARAAGLDPSELYGWRRKALASGSIAPLEKASHQEVRFARVEPVSTAAVEIVVRDVVVRVTGDVDPDHLTKILHVVRKMIASGVVVYFSCQPVDFRKGAASLMALVRDGGLDPFSGALHVFRSKRNDRIRIVWWDGSGVCLYSKVIEGNGFCWLTATAARIRLDHAQLMALLAGIDWKKIRQAAIRRPVSTGWTIVEKIRYVTVNAWQDGGF